MSGEIINENMYFVRTVSDSANILETKKTIHHRKDMAHDHSKGKAKVVLHLSDAGVQLLKLSREANLTNPANFKVVFGDGPLGLDLEKNLSDLERYGVHSGRRASGLDFSAVVKSVSGQGAIKGIQVGNYLVSVNGKATNSLSFKKTMDVLRKASRPVTLEFMGVLSPLVLDTADLQERLLLQWNYNQINDCTLNDSGQIVFRVQASSFGSHAQGSAAETLTIFQADEASEITQAVQQAKQAAMGEDHQSADPGAGAAKPQGETLGPRPTAYLDALRDGGALLKFSRYGEPHFRQFTLSSDMTVLNWYSPKKKTKPTSVLISQIHLVLQGQTTDIFKKHRSHAQLAHLSFSLYYSKAVVAGAAGGGENDDDEAAGGKQKLGSTSATLDLCCKDTDELNTWVTGMQWLVKRARLKLSGNLHSSDAAEGIGGDADSDLPTARTRGISYSSNELLGGGGNFQSQAGAGSIASSAGSLSFMGDEEEEEHEAGQKLQRMVTAKGFDTQQHHNVHQFDAYTWGHGGWGQLGHGKPAGAGGGKDAAPAADWKDSSGGDDGIGDEHVEQEAMRDRHGTSSASTLTSATKGVSFALTPGESGEGDKAIEVGDDWKDKAKPTRIESLAFHKSSDDSGAGEAGTAANMKSIACGFNHTAGVAFDGSVYVWGHSGCGRVGVGVGAIGSGAPKRPSLVAMDSGTALVSSEGGADSASSAASPLRPSSSRRLLEHQPAPARLEARLFGKKCLVRQLACGHFHTLAVTDVMGPGIDGTGGGALYAWGSGFFHQLGIGGSIIGGGGDRTEPTRVHVSVKRRHVHRTANGGATNAPTNAEDFSVSESSLRSVSAADELDMDPVDVRSSTSKYEAEGEAEELPARFVSVAAGLFSSAAISSDGRLYSWGSDSPMVNVEDKLAAQRRASEVVERDTMYHGVLGHGLGAPRAELRPRVVSSLKSWRLSSVSCGDWHMVAVGRPREGRDVVDDGYEYEHDGDEEYLESIKPAESLLQKRLVKTQRAQARALEAAKRKAEAEQAGTEVASLGKRLSKRMSISKHRQNSKADLDDVSENNNKEAANPPVPPVAGNEAVVEQEGDDEEEAAEEQEVSASALVNAKAFTEMETVRVRARNVGQACVLTWGWGACGQLGHGDYENCYSPKVVNAIHTMSWSTVISADCGAAHTAAIVGRNEDYAHEHEQHTHGAAVDEHEQEARGRTRSTALGAEAEQEALVRLVGEEKKVFTWGLGLPAAGDIGSRCACYY
jgi:alpha-tubulin suppressor-like RCC1 family protein